MRIKSTIYKDIKRIYELEKATFNENAFDRNLFQKLINLNLLFLKLEKGLLRKKIIGFLIMIKDKKDRANLINFLIEKPYRNMGFGKRLLNHALELIRTNHPRIRKIILNVKINNSAAIHLYEKFNFTIVDTIQDYYRSGDSAYIMILVL